MKRPSEKDLEFETVSVTDVTTANGGWMVERDDGWHLFVPSEDCSTAPTAGEEMRCYGRGIGYPVRGIVVGGRVYRYETPEEHEVSQREMRERLTREREESEATFRAAASSRPPLRTFECVDPKGWAECVRKNSQDPYSYECVRYAAAWAHTIEARLDGKTVAEVAKQAASDADGNGITGFMYGAAVAMLAGFWAYGDDLRRWHNSDTQIGNEGDRANESGGVLNPALLSTASS